ncbi:MAG: FecR domain-containing protein [Vulcanimicrobiaceae bacterium]
MMILLRSSALFCAAVVLVTATVSADADKSLQNMKGTVSYQHGTAASQRLAQSASIALHDTDYAITGAQSEAGVSLPDSSKVLVGSDTKVQLAFFNQVHGTNAKFIIYNGKTRFTIEHPNGAKANYVFQTPTANVSVRGTQGDIGVDSDGSVRVNVYNLSNPKLPVMVSTTDGKSFTLGVGQTLLAHFVNGKLQETVGQLSQQLIDHFSGEFGVPENMNQLKSMLINKVTQHIPIPPIPVSVPGIP